MTDKYDDTQDPLQKLCRLEYRLETLLPYASLAAGFVAASSNPEAEEICRGLMSEIWKIKKELEAPTRSYPLKQGGEE